MAQQGSDGALRQAGTHSHAVGELMPLCDARSAVSDSRELLRRQRKPPESQPGAGRRRKERASERKERTVLLFLSWPLAHPVAGRPDDDVRCVERVRVDHAIRGPGRAVRVHVPGRRLELRRGLDGRRERQEPAVGAATVGVSS